MTNEDDMTPARRISQGIAGLAIATFGVVGLTAAWSPVPVTADESRADAHEAMHAMMEAMHGTDAMTQMHQVEGAEQMMDQCAGMMETMGGMSSMMTGGGMANMMGG